MLEIIVEQSNLYVVQKDPSKPLGLTKPEIERWLGILLNISIKKDYIGPQITHVNIVLLVT